MGHWNIGSDLGRASLPLSNSSLQPDRYAHSSRRYVFALGRSTIAATAVVASSAERRPAHISSAALPFAEMFVSRAPEDVKGSKAPSDDRSVNLAFRAALGRSPPHVVRSAGQSEALRAKCLASVCIPTRSFNRVFSVGPPQQAPARLLDKDLLRQSASARQSLYLSPPRAEHRAFRSAKTAECRETGRLPPCAH